MMATKKILLVDDDYDFLESLQLILINDGHDVFPATSGSEAVTRYRELLCFPTLKIINIL